MRFGEHRESESKENDTLTILPEHLETIVHKAEAFEGTEDQLKDYLFHEYARQALVEDFQDAMYGFESADGTDYFEEEEIQEFMQELLTYNDEEILAALSVPMELKKAIFAKIKQELSKTGDIKVVCQNHVKKMVERGFSIGFHTSPYDIRPAKIEVFKPEGRETLAWTIKPTEADHRDEDITRAYYSQKYRHLYKKSDSKYIYIVRTDPSHRTDGNWSRASGLSVITRIPLQETIRFVESTAKDNNEALAA